MRLAKATMFKHEYRRKREELVNWKPSFVAGYFISEITSQCSTVYELQNATTTTGQSATKFV